MSKAKAKTYKSEAMAVNGGVKVGHWAAQNQAG